jgi:hypothetical protein
MKILRLLVALLLLGCGTITAQSSRNFGFVSPNTRDNLRLQEAIQAMDSQEELDLLSRAKNLGCVVKQTITTEPAVGSWSDGAENSILIRVNANEATIRYLMSRLGRDANQKAVLYFHPTRRGRAKIYVIRHINGFNFRQIGNVLDESGIHFRTLVLVRHGTIVYIIDLENTLRRNVLEAARRLRYSVTSQSGNAAFIGDDSSRDKGQAVFAEEIKRYELKHPKLPPPCEAQQ